MYKGLRLTVLSRIIDSGGLLKTSNINGITTLRSYTGWRRRNNESQGATHIVPFSEFIETRLSEAKRSLLVEVKTEHNLNQLFTICEKYGEIEKVFLHELSKQRKMLLLEMKDKHYSDLFEQISQSGPPGIPEMYSPFVKADFDSIVVMQTSYTPSLVIETNRTADDNGDKKSLNKKSVLWNLYNDGTITDFDMRLRFLVVAQLQSVLKGLWRNVRVVPFGGSVNGFGGSSSDLDMTVLFESAENKTFITFRSSDKNDVNDCHTQCFGIISELLKLSVPGCSYVTPIPGARVPIVKFFHKYIELECDLSVHSTEGVLSTELMYYVAHLHPLVKPLAFVLKQWGKNVNLITGIPGKSITSFGLLSMVIFFLQQKFSSVSLPPLAELELDGNMRKPFVEERYASVKRLLSDREKRDEEEDLDAILYKFFDYYSKFNFSENGICMLTGKPVANKRVPLLIVNPLNSSLNITKQVTEKEIKKIKFYFFVAKKFYEKGKCFTEDLFNVKHYSNREKLIGSNHSVKREKESLKKDATNW